jgi:HlyD family secretion protein
VPAHAGPRLRWILLAALVVAGLGVLVLRLTRREAVTAEPVLRGPAIEAVYATGTVEPVARITVKARVAGVLEPAIAREGDAVAAGQVLARVDSEVRGYALAQGRTQLEAASQQAGGRSPRLAALEARRAAVAVELAQARTELDRVERLVATGALPGVDLARARAHADLLDAQRRAAADELRSARLELASTREQLADQVRSLEAGVREGELTAPIAGTVLDRLAEPGEAVAPNQAIFELGDVSTLVVELHVDEADIAKVRAGPDASTVALTFYAFEGRAFEGRVLEVLPEADRVRRSYLVRVGLDAPPAGLRVGMSAEANIVIARRDDAVLLPIEALAGDRAWLIEDGRAVLRPVDTGIRGLSHVEIRSGADAGDLAIVGGGVEEGDRVVARRR